VGLALLRDATERDAELVNRLLAVYSVLRDKNRPLLRSTEKDARRQAVGALAPLAPLSAPELTQALDDQQASIRMAAARAIARGEGRSVTEAAEARLSGVSPAPPAEKRRWLALLSDVDDPKCAQLTRRTWQDETQPDAVRAEALVSLAGCARKNALPDLTQAAGAPNVALQAGALRAVLLLPREPSVVPLVERALGSTDDAVLMAACEAVGAHRLAPLSPRLLPLLDHQTGAVRFEALKATHALDSRKALPRVIAALEKDPDALVRTRSTTLLTEVGGPLAVAALANASKTDADDRVKIAATEGLRKLGVTR
jgi:HEAT repeat protein